MLLRVFSHRPSFLAELENALVSDEEMFPEDEVLQALRDRRKYHLNKLREIDQLLQQKHLFSDNVSI